MDGKATPNRTLAGLVADMAELVARAFFGGIAAAVAMGAAILVLSSGAQASPLAASHPALEAFVAASTSADEPWSAAPTPVVDRTSAGVGALWAKAPRQGKEAKRRAREDADAMQLLLGLVALACIATVAMVGRCAERPGASTNA